MTDNGHSDGQQPSASVVVVSYNTSAHISTCLHSVQELHYPNVETIVVDNGSTDGSVELIRSRFPGVKIVEMGGNKGFAGAASAGLEMASGEIVATVNPDVLLDPEWMRAVSRTLLSSGDVGVVGSKILYPDGRTIQHAGGILHYPLATTDHIGRGEKDEGQYDQPSEPQFVTGAALAMRRGVGRSLHFFDKEYYPLYYEDVDLCWRAREQGLRVVYQPAAVAYHEETVTLDRRSEKYYTYFHANRLRFVVKRYSPEQLMLDFLPVEAARVAGDMEAEDRTASLSLLDNREANSRFVSTGQKWDRLQRHVSEVMQGWKVRERPFTSSAPLFGPLVARLRERINNLSTRWYVQPILQQQVDYNASVARTLREMSRQLEELQARVGVQALLIAGMEGKPQDVTTTQALSQEIEALRARLAQLEMDAALTEERDVI